MATLSVPRTNTSIPGVRGGLPLLGNLLQFRNDRLALQDAAARTGPVARVQLAHLPVYILTDAELGHQVLVEQAGSFVKSAGLAILKPLLGEGLVTAEGEPHRRHRKLLAPAFAPKRLAAYGTAMVEETLHTVTRWTDAQRIDLQAEMMAMTLAIAGRTMFSADVRRDAATVAHGLELGLQAHEESLQSPIRLGYEWPLPRHLKMRRSVKILDQVVYRLISEGRERGTDKGDILSILLLARDEDGSGLSDAQVRDEVMTLLLAGHETTANTLTWTWYELARNPGVLAALDSELATLGDRDVTIDDLPALPYTLAVIEEAMRLHPPVYLIGREATHDLTIGDHAFAKGTIVAVNIRGIHRRVDYYTDPDAFRPERMLPEVKKQRPRMRYLPFGAGPRVCIGSHFALLEAQLALATMARHARLRLATTAPVAYDPQVPLRPKGGMPMIVETR